MLTSPLNALSLILTVVGLLAVAESGGVLALGVGIALSVALTLVRATAASETLGLSARLRSPRRSIDVSTLLAQSDPDAPGRTRPRAPGSAAAAA